jgi:hypothetical protein
MTHTYVIMELSEAAYREIADQMRAAGYDHAFGKDGEIDMHGIAVARTVGAINASPKRLTDQHCATCQCNAVHDERHVPSNPMSRSWHKNAGNGPPK